MKNFADLYNSTNDSLALEQRFYAKLEGTKGSLQAPVDADFFYTLGGGSISFNQPFESSPHRSGRHHLDIIKKKKELSFSFSTYFNIDESLGSASTAEIDPAVRLLMKSLFGKEVAGPPLVYTSATAPDITFSLFEVGDKWSRQARGCFIQSCTMNFPGNGEATMEWSGVGAEAYYVGIAKTLADNDAGNTITLETGEGDRIPVGAFIMLIEADGTTRSADTPNGSPRMVTAKSGDVITVSGAVLADADGSGPGAPIYVSYYEPATPTAINNPVTGLVGSMSLASTSIDCFRSATLAIANDHEVVDYCYGFDTISTPFFVPGSRITATLTVETNLNDEILMLLNRVLTEFEAQDFQLILGSATGRRFVVDVPKARFPTPAFTVPENGSIPISFEGIAYQTALDAADEVTASFL